MMEAGQRQHRIISLLATKRSTILCHKKWSTEKKDSEVIRVETAERVFAALQQLAAPNDNRSRKPYNEAEAKSYPKYELYFEKPEGHIYIHRDFLKGKSKVEKVACAKENLGHPAPSEDDVNDMLIFMEVLLDLINDEAGPLMQAIVMGEARRRNIVHNGRLVINLDELLEAWKDGNFGVNSVEGFFHCIYSCLDDKDLWNNLVFDVMRSLELWYVEAYEGNTKDPRKQKGFVCNAMQDKKRNMLHKRFSRRGSVPHGIGFTISKGKGTAEAPVGGRKAVKQGPGKYERAFCMTRNVTGWMGGTHKQWREDQDTAVACAASAMNLSQPHVAARNTTAFLANNNPGTVHQAATNTSARFSAATSVPENNPRVFDQEDSLHQNLHASSPFSFISMEENIDYTGLDPSTLFPEHHSAQPMPAIQDENAQQPMPPNRDKQCPVQQLRVVPQINQLQNSGHHSLSASGGRRRHPNFLADIAKAHQLQNTPNVATASSRPSLIPQAVLFTSLPQERQDSITEHREKSQQEVQSKKGATEQLRIAANAKQQQARQKKAAAAEKEQKRLGLRVATAEQTAKDSRKVCP